MEFFGLVLTVLAIVLVCMVGALKRTLRRVEGGLQELKSEIRAVARREGRASVPDTPAAPAPAPEPGVGPRSVPPVPAPAEPSAAVPPRPPIVTAAERAAVASPSPPPPPTPRPPAAPAPGRETVRGILGRIWQWFLVGEEFRPAGVTMEYAVATTWLMRAGIVALVMCAAYFLKWSIEHGLLGPSARVGISTLAGAVMVAGGVRLLGRRWDVLGQGFMGGGLAILYFSMYAAGPSMYKLLERPVVFGLMILVTAAAGVLALGANSMLVAIFGIVGGFTTPVLLRSAQPQLPALFSYILLLNLGIFAIAHFRAWRVLNYLGFVFTYLLYGAAMQGYHRPDFPVTLAFLTLFFVVQSLLVLVYNIRRGKTATGLEVAHLLLNALAFSGAGCDLIRGALGRPYPALLTLALAAFYVAHVAFFLRRRIVDKPLLTALLALAAFFALLTLPLVLEKESLTVCWALAALLLLWVGRRLDSRFVGQLAYLAYLILLGRLLLLELPRGFGPYPGGGAGFPAYGQALVVRLWTYGAALLALGGGCWLERRGGAARAGGPVAAANDTRLGVPVTVSRAVLFWSVVGVLFLYLTFETKTLLHWKLPAFESGGVTVLWVLFALAWLTSGIWKNVRTLRYAGLALCAVVVGKVFLADLARMPTIYRVLAFMAVGVFLLLGSFAYLYAQRRFRKEV